VSKRGERRESAACLVPITVDPSDATRVQVDWATLAGERAGGRWDDAPPKGSDAAALMTSGQAPTGPTMTAADQA